MIDLKISKYAKTLWFLAFLTTLGLAIYQRLTGPTHPLRGVVQVGGHSLKYRLKRSAICEKGAQIELKAPPEVKGVLRYRRHLSNDEWSSVPMKRQGESLGASLPKQPPAGKMQYVVLLHCKEQEAIIDNDGPIILRYKGRVPIGVLLPHIIFMFLAMVFSARAGFEALDKEGNVRRYAAWTVGSLLLGGFILGPIVQKYAFGAYWTGWPFGTDLTDNKAAVALLFWLIALWRAGKEKGGRVAVILASLVMVAVYLIPHSVRGSELDYRSGKAVNAAPTAIPQ